MDKFHQMQAFVAVVDQGSFVKAAAALDTSKAAISRRVDVRLLNRTTRKLSLTEEGTLFYARCTDLLDGLQEAESELSQRAGEAAGLIRVSAPVTFGIEHLAPLWGEFLRQN